MCFPLSLWTSHDKCEYHLNGKLLSKLLSSLFPLPLAAAGLTAGDARGPERRGFRRSAGPLGAALSAVLPLVSAVRFGARPGLYVRWEQLLLLQPLVGARVRCHRLLLGSVLYHHIHGHEEAPTGAKDSRKGEFVYQQFRKKYRLELNRK